MLLEMAIGDAYGIGFEFCKPVHVNDLSKFYQHPKYSTLIPGQYSDDTQRALANVRVITTKDPLSFIDYMDAYVDEYQASPRDGYSRGFQSLIMSCKTGQDMMDKISPSRATNGSIMGIAPLGYIENVNFMMRAAMVQATTTHSYKTVPYAQIITLAVHYFLYDIGPKDELLNFINLHTDEEYFHIRPRLVETFSGIFQYSEYEDKIDKCHMEAYSTAMHAIYAVLAHDNLADMLKHCIDVGGDTDSLAAVAMAIGSCSREIENNLPQHLYDTLENNGRGLDYIKQLDNVINNVYFPNTWIAKESKK